MYSATMTRGIPLSAVFQASIYGLTCFAAVILGRAEAGVVPFLTIVIAFLAYLATEPPRNFYIPIWGANLLGLVALGFAGFEFFGDADDAKLLAGAHLVVYLTWIVLLQQKTERQYWAICALGLLQVAVACVLISVNDSWYGIMLVVYTVLAIWTLAVFSLYEAEIQFLRRSPGRLTETYSATQTSTTAAVVRRDASTGWITGEFVAGIVALSLAALTVSAMFFLFIPRVWIGQRIAFSSNAESAFTGGKTITGFATTVKLGDIGTTMESLEPALSVTVTDQATNSRLSVEELCNRLGYSEPLFRGMVLTQYEKGRWKDDDRSSQSQARLPKTRQRGWRLDVVQEPIGTSALFTLGEPIAAVLTSSVNDTDNSVISADKLSSALWRVGEGSANSLGELQYSVWVSDPPTVGKQYPSLSIGPFKRQDLIVQRYLKRTLQFPTRGLDRLTQLAQDLASRGGAQKTPFEKAFAITAFLRDSGQYAYSNEGKVIDDGVDPIVDFLFNRKEGNCEYFNSSLALMLRTLDIPTRLATGFKGGSILPGTDIFRVEQRHAHVWVEALLETPDGETEWIVLDATPAARDEDVENYGDSRSSWQRMQDSINQFWGEYVANVSYRQQERSIYAPLRELGLTIWAGVRRVAELVSELIGPTAAGSNQPIWKRLLVGTVALLALVATLRLLQILIGWLLRNGSWLQGLLGGSKTRSNRSTIKFYEQFAQLMRKQGFERAGNQTQKEFTEGIRLKLASQNLSAALDEPLARLADLFYQIRFGGQDLNEQQLTIAESCLKTIEAAFAPPQAKPSGS